MNSLRTLSWHSRHHYLSFKLLTFLEIEASMNDACRYDISNEMFFVIFPESHCSENEDESREAALTIHVNVDEVARHSTVRNSRIVHSLNNYLAVINVRDDDLKRRDEREVRVSTSWNNSQTNTVTDSLREVRMRKDHLTLVQVSFDSWRNVVSRFMTHWIVFCKFEYIRRSNAHTRHANHTNNQRHNLAHKGTNYITVIQSHERKDQRL